MPIYVEIGRVEVKESFDSKYKDYLAKATNQALVAAVKGDWTRTPPKPGGRGFALTSNVFLTAKEGKLTCVCDLYVNKWPEDALHKKAMGKGSTKVEPKAVQRGDVEAVTDAALELAINMAFANMKTLP